MVPQLPLELIYHILGSIPAEFWISARADTLRACSLVNKSWRVVAQKELPRHISWTQHRPGRMELFLASPSGRDGWHSDSITLTEQPDHILFLLVKHATSINHLDLEKHLGCLYRLDGSQPSLSGECPAARH